MLLYFDSASLIKEGGFKWKKIADLYIEFTWNSEIEGIGKCWQAFSFGRRKCYQNWNI